MKWLVLAIAIASNASASILLKVLVSSPKKANILSAPEEYLSAPLLWAGLFLYGLSFVMYSSSLQNFPLHFAHPVVTVSAIVLVSAFSVAALDEHFGWRSGVGLALVVLGVVLLSTELSDVSA